MLWWTEGPRFRSAGLICALVAACLASCAKPDPQAAARNDYINAQNDRTMRRNAWIQYRTDVAAYNRDLAQFRGTGKGEPPIKPEKPTFADPEGTGEGDKRIAP